MGHWLFMEKSSIFYKLSKKIRENSCNCSYKFADADQKLQTGSYKLYSAYRYIWFGLQVGFQKQVIGYSAKKSRLTASLEKQGLGHRGQW